MAQLTIEDYKELCMTLYTKYGSRLWVDGDETALDLLAAGMEGITVDEWLAAVEAEESPPK